MAPNSAYESIPYNLSIKDKTIDANPDPTFDKN